MVGVRVRHEVRAHVVTGQLAQNPPLGARRSGIDEHVADEVDVDGVRGAARQLMHALGQHSHAPIV